MHSFDWIAVILYCQKLTLTAAANYTFYFIVAIL